MLKNLSLKTFSSSLMIIFICDCMNLNYDIGYQRWWCHFSWCGRKVKSLFLFVISKWIHQSEILFLGTSQSSSFEYDSTSWGSRNDSWGFTQFSCFSKYFKVATSQHFTFVLLYHHHIHHHFTSPIYTTYIFSHN